MWRRRPRRTLERVCSRPRGADADVRGGATAWHGGHTQTPGSVARATLEAARLSGIVTGAQSYVVEETRRDASARSASYEAVSPEAVRHHSAAAALPVDEIVKVADTIVVRPDPAAAAA